MNPVNSDPAETRTSLGGDLSTVIIPLLKGVVYQEADGTRWNTLFALQARIRDYVSVLGLELVLDESEGFAFLRSQRSSNLEPGSSAAGVASEGQESNQLVEAEEFEGARLVSRRALSFPVSLLLALLRKKLAEFDAQSGDTRLVVTRAEIVDLVRVFMADGTNETRIVDQIDAHINKVVDLGFLARMRNASATRSSDRSNDSGTFEVKRILKAFIDAQWLAEFDQRIRAYRDHAVGTSPQRLVK
jgi:Domain of unknown function (DUF4194)